MWWSHRVKATHVIMQRWQHFFPQYKNQLVHFHFHQYISVFTFNTHGYKKDVYMTQTELRVLGNSLCLCLGGLHKAALVCLFVPLKDYIFQNERNGWMTFDLSQGGLNNKGFDNQGHFSIEFYIHFNPGIVAKCTVALSLSNKILE